MARFRMNAIGRISVGLWALVWTVSWAAAQDAATGNPGSEVSGQEVTESSATMVESAAVDATDPVEEEGTDDPVDLDDLIVADDEIVVLDEYAIDTESIKPPGIVSEDVFFETMRDLSLHGNLPVVYADSSSFEQQDTHGVAADLIELPSHGKVVFKNEFSLEFFYLPDEGYIGLDQFSFVPYTYHRPNFEETDMLEKVLGPSEHIVSITVNQLPRAIQTRTLHHDLTVERQINILFVIDNSRSMAGEQKILATSFDRFIRGFLDQNLDFRIGVLTTDAVNVFQPAKRKHTAVFGAGHLQLTSDDLVQKEALDAARASGEATDAILYQPFLDNETPDLTARFSELVQVGTRGYGAETAIVPTMMAYVSKLSPGAIEHNTASFGDEPFFFQPEAFLSIVVVSDEDEAVTWITPERAEDGSILDYTVKVGSQYLARTRRGKEATEGFVASFLNSIQVLKSQAGFRIDAVIHPRKGYTFNRLAEAGGGQVADISRDFSDSLISIGASIARQASRTFRFPEFQIDEVFFPDSLRVRINDEEIPGDPANGWFFDPDRQTIELRGAAGEASFGAVVQIDFEVEYQP